MYLEGTVIAPFVDWAHEPPSISVYCEAMTVAQRIDYDEKTGTTAQRIQARTRRLEKAALAARTVAMIQHSKVLPPTYSTFLVDYLQATNIFRGI